MPQFAPHTVDVPESGIRRIFEVAANLPGPINWLLAGEPLGPIAPHIAEAAHEAWLAGRTRYTPNGGIPEFRTAVADFLRESLGADVAADRVWATVGGTHALYQALGLVLDPGDELLIPDPGYTTFTMATRYHNAVPVPYRLRPEHGFQPEIEALEALVTPRTRAILVNSPSNPLGTVIDEPLARRILDFAERHDLWVISDEVYERLTWVRPHVSLLALDNPLGGASAAQRVIGVYSFSKTYAMTGIRIGALVAPEAAARELRAVQEATVSCVNEPAQLAAIAALTGEQDHVEAARAHCIANYEAGIAVLETKGLRYVEPAGAFYFWIDVSHATGGDVQAWCDRFVRETGVAVAPGAAFGAAGEGWIRVCYAGEREPLLAGLERLPGRVG